MAKEEKKLIDIYFDYQEKYEEMYGKNTIVLMEVGTFFEVYGIDNDDEKIGKPEELSRVCNVQLTRKNKSVIENSRSNPLMSGFPSATKDKYIDILERQGIYTLVIVEQTTTPPNPERDVTEIISPGTTFNNEIEDNRFLCSIYMEKYNNMYNIGVSLLDVSTNKSKIYEFNSKKQDIEYALNETLKILVNNNITELFFNYQDNKLLKEEYEEVRYFLETYFILKEIKCLHFNINELDKRFENIVFQENILNAIYDNDTQLSIIEYLGLERKIYGLISFVALISFAEGHSYKAVINMEKPILPEENKYLKLQADAIKQLDLVGETSLMSMIDNTQVPLGRRLLRDMILNPLIEPEEIEKRYKNIDFFKEEMSKEELKDISNELINVRDIERIHTNMLKKNMLPINFITLNSSYNSVFNIIKIIQENDELSFNMKFKEISKFKEAIENQENTLIIEDLLKYNLTNMTTRIFKPGFNKRVDALQKQIDNYLESLNEIVDKLNEQVKEKNEFILKRTEKEGFYIDITKNRYKNFIKNYEKIEYFNNYTNQQEYLILDTDKEKSVKILTSNVKIRNEGMKELSEEILGLELRLKNEQKELFLNYCYEFYVNNKKILKKVEDYIANVDVLISHLKTIEKYNYFRPQIDFDTHSYSYLEAKGMRHPISEQILPRGETYIPNDISFKKDGMLLFGLNSSGKSTLSKSIALNVIMAQMGMYVPSKSFYYRPYKKLFTRIDTTDSMQQNLSLFQVEMKALKDILDNGDEYSLIFGDEVAKGTENKSGISIVGAALKQITKRNMSFIFCTHLHEVINLKGISDNEKISVKHLDVFYDDEKNKLIYNRKLMSGEGSQMYGIEVAKSLNMNLEFIEEAKSIRRDLVKYEKTKLDKIENVLYNSKRSKYNRKHLMTSCEICGSKENLETHHKIEQQTSDVNGFLQETDKEHIKKNDESNLITLCKDCHKKEHF